MKALLAIGVVTLLGQTSFAPFAHAMDLANQGLSLRLAAREGRVKEVKRLLSEGVSPNLTGEFEESALSYAARYNHLAVVQALLEAGADIDHRDLEEQTALMKASMNCSSKVAAEILARDPSVNQTSRSGRTALHYAAMNGCSRVVEEIAKARGVDLSVKDETGRTPLDYAAEESQVEVGGPFTEIAIAIRKAGGKTAAFHVVSPHFAPREQGTSVSPKGLR